MIIIIICINIGTYIISAKGLYDYFQKAYYHKNGIWKNIKPVSPDMLLVFIPIINTAAVIIFNICSPPIEKFKTRKTSIITIPEKFFKPKN